jgi:hypothetical protein
MNTKLLFAGLLILSLVVSACATKTQQSNDTQNTSNTEQDNILSEPATPQESIEQIIDLPKTCADLGGTWLSDYEECEGMSQADCTNLDGTFDECASACRHNPDVQICTLQCVQVCSFA